MQYLKNIKTKIKRDSHSWLILKLNKTQKRLNKDREKEKMRPICSGPPYVELLHVNDVFDAYSHRKTYKKYTIKNHFSYFFALLHSAFEASIGTVAFIICLSKNYT